MLKNLCCEEVAPSCGQLEKLNMLVVHKIPKQLAPLECDIIALII